MGADRRCSSCGALVGAEAEWCGQCYAPLAARAEAAVTDALRRTPPPVAGSSERPRAAAAAALAPGAAVPDQVPEGAPTWPCPSCGNRNPIELDACEACGTAFARLFREPPRRVEVAPRAALLWSLAFPGLGHARCGRGLEGLARGILFVWTTGTAAVLVASGSNRGGPGSVGPLVILFLAAAAGLYGLTAADAFKLASGEPPIVSSRTLLWAVAGLVLLSVAVATIISVGALGAR